MIPNWSKDNTLLSTLILSGADNVFNRLTSLVMLRGYLSAAKMEIYIAKSRPGRMILESVDLVTSPFLTAVASTRLPHAHSHSRSRTLSRVASSSNLRNQATIQDGRVIVQQVQRRQGQTGQILDEEQLAFLADLGIPDGQTIQTIIPNNAAFQTEDLDTYDSDCDDISNAKAVLMANISNYGSDIISEATVQDTNL
ncbi:hypothetical protein Tco_1227693 [Tanacetum coccineum]